MPPTTPTPSTPRAHRKPDVTERHSLFADPALRSASCLLTHYVAALDAGDGRRQADISARARWDGVTRGIYAAGYGTTGFQVHMALVDAYRAHQPEPPRSDAVWWAWRADVLNATADALRAMARS